MLDSRALHTSDPVLCLGLLRFCILISLHPARASSQVVLDEHSNSWRRDHKSKNPFKSQTLCDKHLPEGTPHSALLLGMKNSWDHHVGPVMENTADMDQLNAYIYGCPCNTASDSHVTFLKIKGLCFRTSLDAFE